MAGTAEVIQEYLVSLGFKTDAISMRKFDSQISASGKNMLKMGATVATVIASVEAAAAAFAYSMRRVYFESELSNTTVKNLKAAAFAGRQFGIAGEQMTSAIHGMAQAFRLNPGLQGLVESFGVPVQGRDVSDVMFDFVGQLRKMPEFVGAQYAALFGMDPDTYHQLITHYDEVLKKKQALLDLYKQSGIDIDAGKQTVLEYTGTLDKLSAQLDVLGQGLMIRFLPAFRESTDILSETIDWWTKWAVGINKVSGALDGLTSGAFWKDVFSKDTLNRFANILTYFTPFIGKFGEEKPTAGGSRSASGKISGLNAGGSADQAMRSLMAQGWTREQAAGIVANLQRESNFNPGAVGDSGKAYGIAQWHPDRQAEFKRLYGKDIKGSSFEEQLAFLTHELRQGNEQAAGRKLAMAGSAQEAGEIVSRYYERPLNADSEAALRGAAAARLGLSNGVGGTVTQNNTTNINVSGVGAEATANAVASKQDKVYSTALRNLKGQVS